MRKTRPGWEEWSKGVGAHRNSPGARKTDDFRNP
jgi:hypothetical protein